MKKENVIIGWGLAGAVMGWQLYFKGEKFEVYDAEKADSTRAAAGLINPIVFKRQNLSWRANDLLPYADNFYTAIEERLGVNIISRKNIYRVFSSVEEENNWSVKQGDERYKNYLKTPAHADLPSNQHVDYPYGIGEVDTIGYLDTNQFLDCSRQFFERKGYKFNKCVFQTDQVVSNQQTNFLFCEGVGLFQNPLFNYLPLKGTHGEVLIIKTTAYTFKDVLNKNMYLLPIAENKYKIGATYNWDLKQPVITNEARQELVERLTSFTDFEYEVVEQKAGVRPTVVDRKPLVGVHPIAKNAFVFNGLGTKGVMLAPFFSNQLLDFIFKGRAIDAEVDIDRHKKYFYTQSQV